MRRDYAEVTKTLTLESFVTSYAAELAEADGSGTVTDKHRQDAERMWYDMHAMAIEHGLPGASA